MTKAIREKSPQARASEKYDQANTVQLKLKLNKKTDADILDFLERSPNKQGLIKYLIREEIKKGR